MKEVLLFLTLLLCKDALSNRQSEQQKLQRIKRQNEELKYCNKCGLSFDEKQRVPVIINGTNVASSQKYPWMVALIQTGTDHIFCGGAIIGRYWILTAGHCMVDIKKKMKLENTMKESGNGGKKRVCSDKESCKGLFMSSQQVTVGFLTPGWYTGVKPRTDAAEIFVHPQYYYEWGKPHDIALIKLVHPINCNTHANPICLPPTNIILPPTVLVKISGYGQQDPYNPVPAQELSEATIQAQVKEECLNMGFEEEDLDKMYCLRGYKGETPCFGDSGGSMFSKLYGKRFVTLGVASLQSSPTCDWEANVVYTSVSHHLSWIQQLMKNGSKDGGGGQDYGGGDYGGGDYGGVDYGGGDYYGAGDYGGGDYAGGDYVDGYNYDNYYDFGMKGKKEKTDTRGKSTSRKSTQKAKRKKPCSKKNKTTSRSTTKKGKERKRSLMERQ